MPVESAVIANHRADGANAAEVPEARNPVAVVHVAGRPEISGAGAGRNVSHRSAHADSKFGCLRLGCSQGRYASHHCRTQHPIPHAAHNPFLPAGSEYDPGPASLRLEACLLLPPRRAGYVLIQQRLGEKVATESENKFAQLSQKSGVYGGFLSRLHDPCRANGTVEFRPACLQLLSTCISSGSAASA